MPYSNPAQTSRVCSISLLKTLWEKEKLLVTSNFSFSHGVFYLFGERKRLNPYDSILTLNDPENGDFRKKVERKGRNPGDRIFSFIPLCFISYQGQKSSFKLSSESVSILD